MNFHKASIQQFDAEFTKKFNDLKEDVHKLSENHTQAAEESMQDPKPVVVAEVVHQLL